MGTINPSLPTISNPNSTEDPLIRSALSTIIAEFNGNIDNNNIKSAAAIAYSKLATMNTGQVLLGNAGVPTATTLSGDVTVSALGVTTIGANKINSSHVQDGTLTTNDILDGSLVANDIFGTFPDSKLTSPNNATYKTIFQAGSMNHMKNMASPIRYLMNSCKDVTTDFCSSTFTSTDSNVVPPPHIMRLSSADLAVGGLSEYFRIQMQVAVGSTSPGALVITCALAEVSISGGAWGAETNVTGSTVASSGLSTNNMFKFNSSDFLTTALPTDPGNYCIVIIPSGATAPAGIQVSAQLQMRAA